MLNVWKWWKCVVVLHEKYLLTTTRHADKNVINCGSYLPKSNKSIVDIRVLPDAASCLPRYVQTWRHLQSRKKVTCCIVVRGGTTHGHRQQAQKIFWSLDPWFLRYASGQTDSSYYTVIPKKWYPSISLICRSNSVSDMQNRENSWRKWQPLCLQHLKMPPHCIVKRRRLSSDQSRGIRCRCWCSRKHCQRKVSNYTDECCVNYTRTCAIIRAFSIYFPLYLHLLSPFPLASCPFPPLSFFWFYPFSRLPVSTLHLFSSQEGVSWYGHATGTSLLTCSTLWVKKATHYTVVVLNFAKF